MRSSNTLELDWSSLSDTPDASLTPTVAFSYASWLSAAFWKDSTTELMQRESAVVPATAASMPGPVPMNDSAFPKPDAALPARIRPFSLDSAAPAAISPQLVNVAPAVLRWRFMPPNAPAIWVTDVRTVPRPTATGPAAATMPANPTMAVFVSSDIPPTALARSPNHWPRSWMIGAAPSAMAFARYMAWLRILPSSPEKPSDLRSASRMASPASSMPRAPRLVDMPFHASFAMPSDSARTSVVLVRPARSCLSRTPVMPRPTSVWSTLPPSSLMLFRPSTNRWMATAGRSFHWAANSSAVMPLMRAYSSRASPPEATAPSMRLMVRCIEEPAASAFWPVAVAAVARPSMSDVVMFTFDAMPAKRVEIFMMSDSRAGSLLPRRTRASANESYSSLVKCMMLDSFARSRAMSSVSMFVAMSRFDTVCENASRSSTAMPSWPPMASMSSICDALVTCVVENSSAAFLRLSKSSSVPFTVLRMSRYDESMSSAAWMA